MRDMIRQYEPAAAEKPRPLRFTHGPTDITAYVLQRMLFSRVGNGRASGTLEVEEAVFDILDRVLARAYEAKRGSRDTVITREDREIADRARTVLIRLTTTHVTLAAIGRQTGVSVFHLSRIFRKVTGRTLAVLRS
ncbi:MAG: helix-turn-helix transcriptional regulator [Acidobacteria bacterium]|nr:helix-turn-helix transcriptional regulator [Acidobacteriota bacterium]